MIAAVITGFVGSDVELKFLNNGTAVLNFSVASNDRKQVNGEWQDVPTWVRCALFGKRGEGLAKILQKGSSVAVRGALSTRSYDDRDGVKRTVVEVRADDVELTGKRDGGERAPRAAAPAQAAAKPSEWETSTDYTTTDDQIPF